MYLSIKLGSLHHIDEAWLELKLEMFSVKCWTYADILNSWSREFKQGLFGHGFRNW
jgi:hypothetical protein